MSHSNKTSTFVIHEATGDLRRLIASAETFIEEATKSLKGPLSNLDRALLVADRKDAREAKAHAEADLARLAESAP